MTDLIRFASWPDVPHTYMTKSQLAALDLPRRPGPDVRARVEGKDFRDKDMVIDLYDVTESLPSNTSISRLVASRARGGTGLRRCTECGARPDLPCTPYEGDDVLCGACLHIRWIQRSQRDAAVYRQVAAQKAVELLADDQLAIVHVDLTERGKTDGGVRRKPSAAHLVALDNAGSKLIDILVRLVGPRSAGIPSGAVAPEDVVDQVREVFSDRQLLTWGAGQLTDLAAALYKPGQPQSPVFPTGFRHRHDLQSLTLHWRGDINPRTRTARPAVAPGRADRMHYLLCQIAADATPTEPSIPGATR